MDGNGRWAKARGMARYEGHTQGAKAVKTLVKEARELGIKYLTLYTFSSENWNRPAIEIAALMKLLEIYLSSELKNFIEQGVRLRTIGDLSSMPEKLQKLIAKSEESTKHLKEMELILALSYGGRQEIVNTVQKIAGQVKAGDVAISEINEDLFSKELYTKDWPDPELLIRTSNEQRLSNFLLWQLSYAEFIFVPELWPDFTPDVFRRCIVEYNRRQRRFGKV